MGPPRHSPRHRRPPKVGYSCAARVSGCPLGSGSSYVTLLLGVWCVGGLARRLPAALLAWKRVICCGVVRISHPCCKAWGEGGELRTPCGVKRCANARRVLIDLRSTTAVRGLTLATAVLCTRPPSFSL